MRRKTVWVRQERVRVLSGRVLPGFTVFVWGHSGCFTEELGKIGKVGLPHFHSDPVYGPCGAGEELFCFSHSLFHQIISDGQTGFLFE